MSYMSKHTVMIFPWLSEQLSYELAKQLRCAKNIRVIGATSCSAPFTLYRDIKVLPVPFIHEKHFRDVMNDVCVEEGVDFVVPTHDDVALCLSQLQPRLKARVLGQSVKANRIARYKDKTYSYFRKILPVARMYDIRSDNNVDPVFVKPKVGQGGKRAQLLRNEQDKAHFLYYNDPEEFVCMEYLPGDEITVDCFSDKGNVLYAGARQTLQVLNGVSSHIRQVNDPDIAAEMFQYGSIISEKLKMHGCWFFEMKRDSSGQMRLLEIATRPAASLMFQRALGVNFMKMAVDQALGRQAHFAVNPYSLELRKYIMPYYKATIEYDTVYVSLEDTLLLPRNTVNLELIKLLFQANNDHKKVILLTTTPKACVRNILRSLRLQSVFDGIHHVKRQSEKVSMMKGSAILIDQNQKTRAQAIKKGFCAFELENLEILHNI
jgi:carbamoyl-phosphate synthase large subunit